MQPTKEELIDCIKNFLGLLDTPLGRKRFPGDFADECINIGRDLVSRSTEVPPQVFTDDTSAISTATVPGITSELYLSNLDKLTISAIARLIAADWPNPNYAAAPYLEAMHSLGDISDSYFADSGKSVITRFLANAQSWKGETAKAIKAELKRRCNLK